MLGVNGFTARAMDLERAADRGGGAPAVCFCQVAPPFSERKMRPAEPA